MSVYDLIAEQDEAKAHEYTFCLWPRLWQQYAKDYGYTFNWQERKFLTSEADNVPDEPGLTTVMHFDADNLAEQDVNKLREFVRLLQSLARYGAI